MRPLYRNLFFALGIAAVWLMVRNLDVTWAEAATAARRAGIWLPACLLLWLVIYLMNAWAWSLIIRSGEQEQQERSVGFWRIMKYTVTGYALNYVTPAGVLGGEPYRIMELRPFLGTERAVSCVLLNSMMHIFSHFCFWAFCIVLFVDEQITALHRQNPRTFIAALSLEVLARLLGCLELQFILFVFTDEVALVDCIAMQGLTSLLANIIFFIPMQVGVREAGMAVFADFSLLNGSYGVLTSLIVRLREIFWITIGMCLLKVCNPHAVPSQQSNVSVS